MHAFYCANNILHVSAPHAHPKHLVPYHAGVSPTQLTFSEGGIEHSSKHYM